MQPSDIKITSGHANMRLDDIQPMLADTYWSPGITVAEIKKGLDHSALAVGAFLPDGRQIGFLRVVSDTVRFAYIMDVVVNRDYRRRGIGRMMVRHTLGHPDLSGVYQWLLVTNDAHGVYKQCGFAPLPDPTQWMMIRNPRPDRSKFG